MKSSSKKLIRLVKGCLDVAWYGNFVLAAIGFSFLVYLFFFSESNFYEETSAYIRTPRYIFKQDISGNTGEVKNAILRTNIAYLSYEIRSTPLVKFSAFFFLIAIELLIFTIIFHLRKLFGSLNRGIPFTEENVKALKWSAFFITMILPVQLGLYLFERYFFNTNFPASYGFSVEADLNFEVLAIAAILYITAEIFKHGLELKKENEEFV